MQSIQAHDTTQVH